MILLTLLIVLVAERTMIKTKYWQINTYMDAYRQFLIQKDLIGESSGLIQILIYTVLPAILVYFFLALLDATILTMLVSMTLMLVCVGCPGLRANYKGYLKAATRGDNEACELYQEQIGYQVDEDTNFGKFLVWVNYQHYAAVILWFVAFGSAGAVFYVLIRSLISAKYFTKNSEVWRQSERIRYWVDFVPARLVSFGLLLVGDFSKALPVWIANFFGIKHSPYQIITQVAKAAEDIEPMAKYCTEEPCSLVRLAKRNMMFILVTTSLLTISGWLA